jgi:hypothetical protein
MFVFFSIQNELLKSIKIGLPLKYADTIHSHWMRKNRHNLYSA